MEKTVLYFSAYPLHTDNASTVRARYFTDELKKHFDVEVLVSLVSPVKNHRPNILRLMGEIMAGLEFSMQLILRPRRWKALTILSSPPYITILIAAFSLILLNRKFILDIRDPYPEVYFDQKLLSRTSIFGKIFTFWTKYIYTRALGISVATEGIGQIVENNDINRKVEVILNGFDPNIFYPIPKKEKFKKFTLVFHGNLAKMQNIDLLIEMAKRCPKDIDILVAGWGQEEGKIKREKNITFLGRSPYTDIARAVSKAHVGLSFRKDGPINKISFPVKVFEYIGAGLPVISTPRNSEAGIFLEENNLGYRFETSDIEGIMKKIFELKTNHKAVRLKSYEKLFRQNLAKKFATFVLQVTRL